LFETEHKIAGLRGPSTYPSDVVITEVLLINCRSEEGYISRFVQQITDVF
jgi:hypothetical protein